MDEIGTGEFFMKISEKTISGFIRGFIGRRWVVLRCRLSHIRLTSPLETCQLAYSKFVLHQTIPASIATNLLNPVLYARPPSPYSRSNTEIHVENSFLGN